jgi:hypothetical protein
MDAKCPAVAVVDMASLHIVKILHIHCHTSNQLREVVHQKDRRMLATATAVGRVYTIVSKIKTNPGHSENPEAASISAGLELLPKAICRENCKSLGQTQAFHKQEQH